MNSNLWIYPNRLNPKAKLRLFCFPYSGASASIFFSWLNEIPTMIEVLPVQLPGRGNRVNEDLINRIDILVEKAFNGLKHLFDQPYVFFGHSLGALLSFELARVIRKTSYSLPKHLILSGHGAPHLPDQNPHIHALPDDEFIKKLYELNGMSKEVLENRELMEMIIPVIRTDFEACETYIYQDQDPLNIPISAYGGIEDPYVSKADLEGWQKHSLYPTLVRMFPGDHFYINTSRFLLLNSLVRELSKYIQSSDA
jgi:surfactin synthase thioesterase subunit